jgi:hypothetical protein
MNRPAGPDRHAGVRADPDASGWHGTVAGVRRIDAARVCAIACLLAASPVVAEVRPSLGHRAADEARAPLALVPADAQAVVWSSGSVGSDSPGAVSSLAFAAWLLDELRASGAFTYTTEDTRAWVDGVSAAPLVLRHPVALALLELEIRSLDDGGHRLARCAAMLAIDTGEENGAVQRRVQHLLSTYANTEQSALIREEGAEGVVFTLRDRRLPAWAELAWGEFGGVGVATVGRGAMDAVRAALRHPDQRLVTNEWFRAALATTGTAPCAIGAYGNLAAIARSNEGGWPDKVRGVLGALGAGLADRVVVTARRDGRSVDVRAVLRRPAGDDLRILADARAVDGLGPGFVPAEARSFAAFTVEPRRWVRAAADAYLASRSPSGREDLLELWGRLEAESGVDFDRDILDRLGVPLVIHDHPPSALGLPLARTIVVPVRGDPAELRAALDRLLSHVAERMKESTRMLRLVREPDGLWYLRFGLMGPAVIVSGDRVVVSFAPPAVRANVPRTPTTDTPATNGE